MNWSRTQQQKEILQGKNKNTTGPSNEKNTYLAINAIFAGIIILVFIYSGFFCPEKNNYPLECIHEKITGQPCPSCGLSRSFSFIMRGDISTAASYNKYGLRVFLFFLFHLVMRLSNIVYIIRKPVHLKELTIIDSSIAIITFILAFGQFFVYYLQLLF